MAFSRWYLAFLLACLCVAGYPAFAQPNIDDVINQLDQDFTFGGKEDLKRDNIQQTNEQNREDIKIQEEEQRLQSLQNSSSPQSIVDFIIAELNIGTGDDLDVSVTIGGLLATGLDDNVVNATASFPPGSSQTISVTCNAASVTDCLFSINITNALFGAPIIGSSTGTQVLSVGNTKNFVIVVNAAPPS